MTKATTTKSKANKRHSPPLLRKQTTRQTSRQIDDELLTPDEWVEKYGKEFGISSSDYVRQMCRGDRIGKSLTVARLPEGWEAKKFGNAWMIFRSKERKP